MSAIKLTGPIALCRECGSVYVAEPGHRLGDSLPCGHKDISYMMPSALLSAESDALFVGWMDRNGYLDEAIEGIEREGGNYDPCGCGADRLTLPRRSVNVIGGGL